MRERHGGRSTYQAKTRANLADAEGREEEQRGEKPTFDRAQAPRMDDDDDDERLFLKIVPYDQFLLEPQRKGEPQETTDLRVDRRNQKQYGNL